MDTEIYYDSTLYKRLEQYWKGQSENQITVRNPYEQKAHDILKEYYDIISPIKYLFQYKKVIFNKPATIVLWADGTKTVVKCGENDIYDKEKGLALCFMKKALGGKSGPFNKVLKKEIPESKEHFKSKEDS